MQPWYNWMLIRLLKIDLDWPMKMIGLDKDGITQKVPYFPTVLIFIKKET